MFQDRTANEMSDDSDGKYRVFRTAVDSIFHENRHQTICSIFADIILTLYLGALYFFFEKQIYTVDSFFHLNIFSLICDSRIEVLVTKTNWLEVPGISTKDNIVGLKDMFR